MGVFEKILHDGISRGVLPARTQSARDWYRDAAKNFAGSIRAATPKSKERVDYARINERKFITENSRHAATTILPGSMYMYMYDPKYKDELPFYDTFPLVLPFRVTKDHIYALNLHYLPLPLRAKLFDALYDLTNNKKFDHTTKLKISYQILNKASKFKLFKPCVKCYLKSHIQSKFLYIEPEFFDICLFLPLERFKKASKTQVWADSKRKLRV